MRVFPEVEFQPVVCPCCARPIDGVVRRSLRHRWTREQDSYIKTARAIGASTKLIAYTLGTSPHAVADRLSHLERLAADAAA